MELNSNCDKCLICRKLLDVNQSKVYNPDIISTNKTEAVFTAWKRECATAICHVVFGKTVDYIVNYLQKAHYCSGCEQLVRDVGYIWKQMQLFKRRISDLSAKMCTLIDLNYQMIEAKSKPETTQQRISCLLNTTAPLKVPDYSYKEMVEIIYSVVSRSLKSDLEEFACPYSSFSNTVEIHPDSVTLGTSYDSPCGYLDAVNQVKKECSYMEQEAAGHPLFNEDADNDVQIKSESYDSNFDECNESIEINGFGNHEDLPLDNDDCSNCSSDYQVKGKKRRRGRPPLKLNKKSNEKTGQKYSSDEQSCDGEANKEIYIRKGHKGGSKQYNCLQCGKNFANSILLKGHINHVHEEGKVLKTHNCRCCGTKYIDPDDLSSHYSTSHQEPNPYRCAFCPEVFLNSLDLTKHTKQSHHQSNVCKVCDAVFINHSLLNNHELKRHKGKAEWLRCSICYHKFPCQSWLKAHIKSHKQSTYFKCDICQLEFKSLSQLQSHSELHIEGEFTCSVCENIFPSLYDLKVHESTHTPKPTVKEQVGEPIQPGNKKIRQIKSKAGQNNYNFECKVCCKGYFKEKELNGHYAVAHLGPNPFACAFCPQIFSNSFDLTNHVKCDHPDPNSLNGKLKCDLCGGYFANRNSLGVHKRAQHTPRFLFKCHLCSAVFKQRFFLNTHLDTHGDERKYVCELCGKAYKQSAALQRHSKTHDEKQRKYACKICGKKFFNVTHCKNHEKCHSDIKEFVCHICGKYFSRDCYLKEHLKIHTDLPKRVRKKFKLKSKETDSKP